MAWIKLEHDLLTSPKFITLASRLRHGRVTVLGALATLWMAADRHCIENRLNGMTLEAVDALVEIPGFGQALVEIGWIKVHADSVEVVDYQEHNGATAKSRLLAAKRSKSYRETRHDPVTHDRDDSVTKTKTETKNKKKKKEEAAPLPPEELVFTFPCDGPLPTWQLSKAQVARWSELYPKLDVLDECRKALAWVESNPTNRKTAGRMAAFLNGWLGRSTNKPSQVHQPPRAIYQPKPATIKASEFAAQKRAEREGQLFNGPPLSINPVPRLGGGA